MAEKGDANLTQEATKPANDTNLTQDIILHKAGFVECLQEINKFMSETGSTTEDALRTRLITHLTSNMHCDRKSDMSDKRSISESGLGVSGLEEGRKKEESGKPLSLVPDKT